MSKFQFRIFVYLSGDTRYHLCTVDTAEMVCEVTRALCLADHPEYARLEVEIAPPVGGQ